MKNRIRRLSSLMLALALLLSMSALAAKQTASSGFRLPEVKSRPAQESADREPEEEIVAEAEIEEIEETEIEEAEAEAPETDNLRRILVVLREGESSLPLYAAASGSAEVLANIGAGELLYVQNIEAEWSYAVYGGLAGYVYTDQIALFNESATPEEEEIIRTVSIGSNVAEGDAVYAGTEIVLTARLNGFENLEYTLQWQYTPDDGENVYDVAGANGTQYAFIIDESNAHYLWRVSVVLAGDGAEQ